MFASQVCHHTIPEFSKPLMGATFTLHRVFYCVARTWVVIGCQCDLLLLGQLLWMNLRRTRFKLRLSRDALVKGLHYLIVAASELGGSLKYNGATHLRLIKTLKKGRFWTLCVNIFARISLSYYFDIKGSILNTNDELETFRLGHDFGLSHKLGIEMHKIR